MIAMSGKSTERETRYDPGVNKYSKVPSACESWASNVKEETEADTYKFKHNNNYVTLTESLARVFSQTTCVARCT